MDYVKPGEVLGSMIEAGKTKAELGIMQLIVRVVSAVPFWHARPHWPSPLRHRPRSLWRARFFFR